MFFFYPWLCQKEKYKVKKKLPRHIGILPRQNQVPSAIASRGTFFLIHRAEYCSTRFIPSRCNCDKNRRMETRSSRRLVKNFSRVLFIKCARNFNYILEKLYYMNLKFDYS